MINWKLKTRVQQPIGLDIGHNYIKMIQLAVNEGQIRVTAADKVRIDPGINGDKTERRNFVISAIKQMLTNGNFRGTNVVSCLPNDELKITSLRLAEEEDAEIEQALRKEAFQRFGLDADKDIINYVLAGNVKHGDEVKNELILFAVDSETIKSHIEMLEQACLRPVSIDTIPYALFRGFERSLRRREDKEQTVVFVDIGSRFTTVVFGRNGEISFVKQIPIGGDNFNHQIASKLGVSTNEAEILRDRLRTEKLQKTHPEMDTECLDISTRQVMVDTLTAVAEELAREISLCFSYYTVTFRGKRVERAIFAGGEAYENILLDVLRRQLTVEISVGQPLRGFDMMDVKFDSDRRGLLCEWAVAVGLSLKGWNRVDDQSDSYERN